MSRVFFTSDLHLGHENLCKNLRGFPSAKENDELIIENWNKTVTKRDIVFLLGDITMENNTVLRKYIPLLQGIIYVLPGNHENRQCCKSLQDFGITLIGNIKYKNFILSHIPIHQQEIRKARGNIHGHIHKGGNNWDLGNEYFNVNCEYHNYTPLLFDNLLDIYHERKLKSIIENNLEL